MTRRFAICLVLAAMSFSFPRLAAALTGLTVFDTVDSVEVRHDASCEFCSVRAYVVVTGIAVGGSAPVTQAFDFAANADVAKRCERLALIAMSKPGKYQFAIASLGTMGGQGDCKLTRVTP